MNNDENITGIIIHLDKNSLPLMEIVPITENIPILAPAITNVGVKNNEVNPNKILAPKKAVMNWFLLNSTS